VDMSTINSTKHGSLALHMDKTFTVESGPSSPGGQHKERGFEFT